MAQGFAFPPGRAGYGVERTLGTPGLPADFIVADEDLIVEHYEDLDHGKVIHIERGNQRHVLTGSGPEPSFMHNTVQNAPVYEHYPVGDLKRPYAGPVHWNALLWTNFPPLYIFGSAMAENEDSEFYKALRDLNTDGKLKEQWVTFAAARQDLCLNTPMPKGNKSLKIECIGFDGRLDDKWYFALWEYMCRRDNHIKDQFAARRQFDNTGMTLGVNALDFSEKIKPVGDIECYIHMNDISGNRPTWGYYHALMRVGGWPYRIARIGSWEGQGPNAGEGGTVFSTSITYFDEQMIWSLLEGGPEMVQDDSGEMILKDTSALVGKKMWAELHDLDYIGEKRDSANVYDPEVPAEKGYVWFTIEESCREPQTGKKAIKIKILDEGIVPCWMDLRYMQIWNGDTPLGYFNEATSAEKGETSVKMYRVLDGTMDTEGKPNSKRRLVAQNAYSKLIFKDPHDNVDISDTVEMGYAIKDTCNLGCTINVGFRPGQWVEEAELGKDEGDVNDKQVRVTLYGSKGKHFDGPVEERPNGSCWYSEAPSWRDCQY